MTALYKGIVLVGTEALPIVLGATGGASDVWTWNHNQGVKPISVEVVLAVNKGLVAPASVVATNPTVNQLVLTNTTGGALSVIAIVTFEIFSPAFGAQLAAAVGVLS